jgi:hypothetical protein
MVIPLCKKLFHFKCHFGKQANNAFIQLIKFSGEPNNK